MILKTCGQTGLVCLKCKTESVICTHLKDSAVQRHRGEDSRHNLEQIISTSKMDVLVIRSSLDNGEKST